MGFASKGVQVEVVVFNGYRYRRYPNAKQLAHRKYFTGAKGLLHRVIWEFHNGPIPEGHQIHHKNGNPTDNRLENLECISFQEHRSKHFDEYAARGRNEFFKAHLESIRPLAAAWHGSPEGIAWHKKHAKDSILKRDPNWRSKKPMVIRTCEVCSKSFETNNSRKVICSTACTSKKRNDKLREEQLSKPYQCLRCNAEFFTVQTRQKYCGRECNQAYNRERRSKLGL